MATPIPDFFDLNWAVLSTIGICYFFVGIMVAGIRGKVTALILVLMIVSAACALANGLIYYQAYIQPPPIKQALALIFQDIAWMIQEAGLPFYGYIIITNVLSGRERVIFLTLFWALMLIVVGIRAAIIAVNTCVILDKSVPVALYSTIMNRLHIGYFLPIALAESVSAFFLIKRFRSTIRSSMSSGINAGNLFCYLMRSTEIRVATLALVGISRTITFSFHVIGDEKGIARQLDLFVYTLTSIFPIVMFIDIVATRRLSAEDRNERCNLFVGPAVSCTALGSPDLDARKHSAVKHYEDIEISAV